MQTDAKQDRQTWLDSLKAGDYIAVRTHNSRAWEVLKIEKRTPGGQIVTRGSRFDKTGSSVGWSYGMPSECHPITDEVKQSVFRRKLLHAISTIKMNELTNETLNAILDLIQGETDQ